MNTLIAMLKALSDKNRLRIVAALLQRRELCACQLTELLGVAGATASTHLAQLQNCGLLQSRKEGRWVFYRLSRDVPHNFPMDWLKESLLQTEAIHLDMDELTAILSQPAEVICRRQRRVKDFSEGDLED